jgi:hypothetical protein
MAERAGAIETGVAGSVDLFHAAGAERVDDVVRPETGTAGRVMEKRNCNGLERRRSNGRAPRTVR